MSAAKPEIKEGEFWTTLKGDCFDIAVLEWCKLFGEKEGKHFWKKIAEDPEEFRMGLKEKLELSDDDWKECRDKLRSYRDSFVAHLDNEPTMHIPDMSTPKDMVFYYYDFVLSLDGGGFFVDLPADLCEYYSKCYEDAIEHVKDIESLR